MKPPAVRIGPHHFAIFSTAILIVSLGFGFHTVIKLDRLAEDLHKIFKEFVGDPSASLSRVIFAAERVTSLEDPRGGDPRSSLQSRLKTCERLLSHASVVKSIDPGHLAEALGSDPLRLVDRIKASDEAYSGKLSALRALLDRAVAAENEAKRSAIVEEFRAETRSFLSVLETRSNLLIQAEDYLYTVSLASSAKMVQYSTTQTIVYAGLLLVLGLSIGLYLKSLFLVQEELTEHKNNLSAMVEHRTEELTRANERLQAEVSERKKIEASLQVAVGEKDTLLKEVYHRIKNNLMMISSLILLEKERSPEETSKAFEALESRVSSIAMIHSKLYRSEDLTNVNLEEYLRELAHSLVRSLSADPEKLTVDCEAPGIAIQADSIIPIGLLATEIITNSIKHGFKRRSGGTISIKGKAGAAGFDLSIGDDGDNPERVETITESESLGSMLIQTLCAQAGGTFAIRLSKGTTYEFAFPLKRGIS